MNFAQVNLIAAWIGILLGFLSGMVLGLFFHGENWLGGYASHKRRLYRLGHISLFGLGAVNFFFWLTVKDYGEAPTSLPAGLTFLTWDPNALASTSLSMASNLLLLGAATMPLCCVLMAHWPKLHLVFALPVISLSVAGALTLGFVIKSGHSAAPASQISTSNSP